ncbi:hypothetical protein PR202_gb08098 [Eleusine coracana subsp. coracana]|uniref:BTB domain-containing protein n=1 Tax=Eleusine coracana subsp. coracana TaxID=191504 RepID=A0AAV5EEA4_ELECO|nr:hypothetical protein PR202_gb08098 [Eleusine coracana subsp. coracana]
MEDIRNAESTTQEFVSVSPPDLHHHLGDLLQSEKGADVVFSVAGQTFSAHRCVLAARSPVFSAELHGLMKEGDTKCVVHIDDMEAGVFKALLRFITPTNLTAAAASSGFEHLSTTCPSVMKELVIMLGNLVQ